MTNFLGCVDGEFVATSPIPIFKIRLPVVPRDHSEWLDHLRYTFNVGLVHRYIKAGKDHLWRTGMMNQDGLKWVWREKTPAELKSAGIDLSKVRLRCVLNSLICSYQVNIRPSTLVKNGLLNGLEHGLEWSTIFLWIIWLNSLAETTSVILVCSTFWKFRGRQKLTCRIFLFRTVRFFLERGCPHPQHW